MNTFHTHRELRPLSPDTSVSPTQETIDIESFNPSAGGEKRTGGPGIRTAHLLNKQGLTGSASSPYRQADTNFSNKTPTIQQRRIDAELASHIHHLSPTPNALLKPVDPSRRLPSSPNPSPTHAEFINFTPITSTVDGEKVVSGDIKQSSSPSLFMRTPPPTAKRKEKRTAVISSKDGSHKSTRYRDIEAMPSSEQLTPRNTMFPTALQDQSPQMFSTNPFSPNTLDMFGHDSSMPMTAPAYSGKSFWDPSTQGSPDMSQGSLMNSMNSMNNTSSQDASMSWYSNPPTRMSGSNDHQEVHSQVELKGAESFMSSTSGVQSAASFMFSLPQTPGYNLTAPVSTLSTDGVDPSLLFGPLSINSDSLPVGDFSKSPDSGYPSVSQAAFISAKPKRFSSGLKVNYQGSTQRSRPTVKRRATDTVTENRTLAHDMLVSGGRNIQLESTSRNEQSLSQPLKNQALTERRASSTLKFGNNAFPVSLTIDASGRAYMEPKVPGPSTDPVGPRRHRRLGIDEDSSSTSSDSSSDDESMTRSRHASFSHNFSTPRNNNQFSGLSRKTGSLKRSRRSSIRTATDVDSPAVSALSSYSAESFSKERSQPQITSNGLVTFSDLSSNSNRGGGGSDEGSIPSKDPGDAQHALREVLEKRSSKRESTLFAETALSRSRLSRSGQFQALSSSYTASPSHSRHIGSLECDTGVSPTTITDPDLATPSTDRESSVGITIRCICNISETGGHLMIQCDSCTKWLHVKCIGLNRRNLPPVYVCVNCTGTTPTVRGGRIRDPTRSNTNMALSPLARKGTRSRRD